MPTTFIKANRKYKQANGEYSDPISYSTSSESVEMTDGTDLQTKIGTMDTAIGNKVDKVSGKGLSTNDYDNTAKGKVDALGTASTKDVPASGNASATQVVMGNDSRLTDSRPASDVSAWAKESTKPTYTASEVGAIATTAKGSNNGVAELDSAGKVPSSQLPSYVDDVLEYDSLSQFPATGETGKIYIAKDTNLSYRWSGTGYVEISPSLALGETSSTAYRGDRGKIAYDHSQLTSGNPHNVTKSDVGLGNVGNFKAVSTEASQGLTDTEKSNARTNIGAGTSNFSGSYNDLSDKPDLDSKLDKAGGTMTGSIVTTSHTAIKPQTNNTGNVGSSSSRYAAGYYNFVDLKGSNTNGSFAAVLRGAEDTGTIEFAKEADSNNDYRQVFQNKDGTLALTSDIEVSEDDIASTQTVSGNVVTVPDAAPINAEDITVDITPVQLGSGTPSPDNIRPIEGWTGAEVVDAGGENKFTDVWTQDKSFNTSGELIAGSDRCATINGNRIKGGTTYKFLYGSNVSDIQFGTFFYDANDSFIELHSWEDSGYTFTTPSNAAIVRFNYKSSTAPTNTQLLEVHTATITFGETVYGCTVDFNTGKVVVNKGIVDLGTLDWSYDSSILRFDSYVSGMKQYGVARTNPFICSIYQTISDGRTWSAVPDGSIYNGINENIHVKDLRYTDATAFKTAVTGQTVCYELATPYTLTLTPAQLKMLKGTNTLTSNGATITLKYQPDNVIGELKGEIQKINSVRPKIYGFHIDGNESDPSAAVTYLQDAVGMRPAKMDYIKDVFDYGSWEDVWFVRDCKPCVLHKNGYVISYLNKNDFSKDIYGDPVYLSIPNHQVMIEFPKIWYKVVPDLNDSSSASVYISPVKLDEDYVDFAYIDSSGAHKEHFYMSAYNACAQTESGTRYLCSLSGQAVSKSLTGQNEIDACKALGTGWYTEDAGEIILINFLLILMGKSLDTKTVFGQGLHTGGSEAINDGFRTGVHNTKGMFYGTNSGAIASNNYNNAVKIFGIENYWGLQWRRYAGDMLVDGHRKIKLCYGNDDGSTTKEFNSTGDGYVDIGCTPSGTSGGYISKMKYTSNGMFSSVSSGTASTYYCSGQWYNNSGTMYALRGGSSVRSALVGAFYVSLSVAFGVDWWLYGASPSYK